MDVIVGSIVSLLSLIAGAILDRIHVNRGRDGERCTQMIDRVDKIVGHFHDRFDSDRMRSQAGVTLFDYQMKSLVDDTTLLPVLGRNIFDGEYTRLMSEIFKLSATDPGQVSAIERDSLLNSVNEMGVDLKKIINLNQEGWRLLNRG